MKRRCLSSSGWSSCFSMGLWTALLVSDTAAAETVAIPASKDNTLYESAGGALSNGAGPDLYAGKTAAGSIRRGIIAFEVADSIPPGSTIQRVSLRLSMSRSVAGPTAVDLHRVHADWGEGTSDAGSSRGGDGAPARPGDATWLHRFFDAVRWVSAGGDFEAAPSADAVVAGQGGYVWQSEQMARDVQGWLDDPSTNFGWLLKGDERVSQTAKRFDSRENPVSVSRPQLLVEFAPPPQAPKVPASSVPGAILLALTLSGAAVRAMVRRARALSEPSRDPRASASSPSSP
ncbi:MAG: DNRLRE domain-containing protein [Planctomycetes bacterium]|nr:DNRLRE domain-containing protein [Planctomycetota bacterium]